MAAMVEILNEDPKSDSHWVEELFPPAYGVTIEDILQGRGPEEDDYEEPARVQRVSAFNPDSIKNVYERVRVMMAFDDEVRKQSVQAGEPQTGTTGDGKLGKDTGSVDLEDLRRSIDLNESCIWNTEEIAVLRKVFKAAKGEITQLKVRVRETEDRNRSLEAKVTEMGKELTDKKNSLTEAKKANRRLKIHCDTLQEEFGTASGKVDMLQDMLEEIKNDRASMLTELHDARVTLDKERLERKRLELELKSQGRKFTQAKMLAEENVKVSFQLEIAELHKKIEELSAELERECNVHSVTRRGLDQLRNHFASLPYKMGGPPNAVTQDEVRTLQY